MTGHKRDVIRHGQNRGEEIRSEVNDNIFITFITLIIPCPERLHVAMILIQYVKLNLAKSNLKWAWEVGGVSWTWLFLGILNTN